MNAGFRVCKIRRMESGDHIFVATFLLPAIFSLNKEPESVEEYIVNWHVPIDDAHYWEYAIDFDRKKGLDKEQLRKMKAFQAREGSTGGAGGAGGGCACN